MDKSTALIGMSGGVDSSVAAYLMLQKGYRCHGATMRLFENTDEDAAAVCYRLGIPFHALDNREIFQETVMADFVRCYEAGLPLTVENVRQQTRLHPRCGTSFLLIVMVISILLFSIASSTLLTFVPALSAIRGSFLYRMIMIVFKLMLLPLVVSFTYEINRWVGRHDNRFTRALSAPGMWMQNFTTNEPDDSMIEVGIAALEAVLPEQEGSDRW